MKKCIVDGIMLGNLTEKPCQDAMKGRNIMLPSETIEALRFFLTNERVNQFNKAVLPRSGHAVAKIVTDHNTKIAE